jgi:hypothetical protein
MVQQRIKFNVAVVGAPEHTPDVLPHTVGLLRIWADARSSRLGGASPQAIKELREALRADGVPGV